MSPVTRFTAEVHECQDKDVILFYRVEDTIRESAYQIPADVLFNASPAVRCLQNALYCTLYLQCEIRTQSGSSLLIIQRGISVFSQCLRMIDVLHRPTNIRTNAEPSSPGMPMMEPERISSRRCSASLSQARLEGLVSSLERLPARRSASSARSFAGSSSA